MATNKIYDPKNIMPPPPPKPKPPPVVAVRSKSVIKPTAMVVQGPSKVGNNAKPPVVVRGPSQAGNNAKAPLVVRSPPQVGNNAKAQVAVQGPSQVGNNAKAPVVVVKSKSIIKPAAMVVRALSQVGNNAKPPDSKILKHVALNPTAQSQGSKTSVVTPTRQASEPKSFLTFDLSPIEGFGDPRIEEFLQAKKFLFQIERNPMSLGAQVFKSYDLFLENGRRIFTIVNRSSKLDVDVTEYDLMGSNGTTVLTFEKHVATWGDEDCCTCCPRVHKSDGIRVMVEGNEVGYATVRDCSYKPGVFYGCGARPCCSRYHVSYRISYTDGDLKVHKARTRGCEFYGLEILDENSNLVGEISIAKNSNRKVNVSTSPDFMLALNEKKSIHPNGIAVFLGLAIRHQLNVLLIHKISPSKYGFPTSGDAPPKRPKPTSI